MTGQDPRSMRSPVLLSVLAAENEARINGFVVNVAVGDKDGTSGGSESHTIMVPAISSKPFTAVNIYRSPLSEDSL